MPRIQWLDDARQDLRHAGRTLRKSAGFATTSILTLALGIGANTAIFSVVHAVLLRPLPFAAADRLVHGYENVPGRLVPDGKPRRMNQILVDDFRALRAQPPAAFSHVTSYGYAHVTVAGSDDGRRVPLVPLSPDVFPMLGVRPIVGRWLNDESADDRSLVISYEAWRRYFNQDPNVLGRAVRFNSNRFSGNIASDTAYTVVGVMPRGFHFPDDYALFWTKLTLESAIDGRIRRTALIARLADGVSLQAAATALNAHRADSTADNLKRAGRSAQGESSDPPRFELVRLQDEVGTPVRPVLTVLSAAVAFVLLIACANVANLQLARAMATERETAVRVALGASRGRLIRQALADSVLLSLAGGVAGALLASGGVRLFRLLATGMARLDLGPGANFPRLDAIDVNGNVLVFTAGLSILTGVAFGLAAAGRRLRTNPIDALRDARSSAAGYRRIFSARGALVIGEIAIATLLFVGSGLLTRSFVKLASVDPGYDPSHVLTFQLTATGETPAARMKAAAEAVIDQLRLIPDVQVAAYANQLPMVNIRDTAGGLWKSADGPRTPAPGSAPPDARLVSRGFFAVFGIRAIAGRTLGDGDADGRPRAIVINQTLARQEFPGENPIGRQVFIGRQPAPWEIVGVVGDAHQFGLDRAPEPQFFVDVRQWPTTGALPILPVGAYFAIRTAGDPAAAVNASRRAVRAVSPNASLDNIATMQQIVSNSMTRPRMYAVLLSIFAAVAVGLAVAGIYGVMAYSVAQRTREIGIRTALGARRLDVVRLVLADSAALTAVGLALGVGGAAALSRFLEALVFGVQPLDPTTFIVVPLTFAIVATLAALVPARRAATVDPLVALRCE